MLRPLDRYLMDHHVGCPAKIPYPNNGICICGLDEAVEDFIKFQKEKAETTIEIARSVADLKKTVKEYQEAVAALVEQRNDLLKIVNGGKK